MKTITSFVEGNMTSQIFKSGYVNIIGRPNVGKSTLLNAFLNRKMAIVTNKAQTTRHRILGILNKENLQIVFSDTPGIIKPAYALHKRMMGMVKEALEDADILLIMTDISESPDILNDYRALQKAIRRIKDDQLSAFLLINKIDLVKKPSQLDALFEAWDITLESLGLSNVPILPISAETKDNIDSLLKQITKAIPEGPAFFPTDITTDRMESFFISEIIREKIFQNFQQEIPYSCEVAIIATEEEERIYRIDAEIIVSRKSHQPIIVGNKGKGIKEIGILSRKELENFLGKKVFLQLRVKTRENWKDRDLFLNQYGYRK